MSSRNLLRRLKSTSNALERAARWRGSRHEVDAANDHYVYELLCYFSIALAAAQKFETEIVAVKRFGKLGAHWPRSHGHKSSFSYIRLNSRQAKPLFELCPGIEVLDLNEKPRSPDVNLLRAGGSATPGSKDLHAIWDAKYVYDPSKRLSDKDVGDFVYTYEELGAPKAPPSWTQLITNVEFKYSGLLTNGDFSTERDAALSKRGICETKNFPHSPQTRPAAQLQIALASGSKRRA
jgi:hypothetical protein